MQAKVRFIHTTNGITVVVNNVPMTVSSSDKMFDDVVKMVNDGATEAEIGDRINQMRTALERKLVLAQDMTYSGGVVLYQGEVLHNYAVTRLIDFIEAGLDYAPLAAFLSNLQKNPSKRVVDSLYEFLEAGNMPLTPDGHFLAYKAVRHDFKDIHSGTFDNSVGARPTMQRNRVDEDPNRTCSAGLHVCSYGYLPHFANADDQVVMCKINPADVVAIPSDYNLTKMRVSSYEVVGVVTDYYKRGEDVLGSGEFVRGPEYQVTYSVDGQGDIDDSFYSLKEATDGADALFEELMGGGSISVDVVYRHVPGVTPKHPDMHVLYTRSYGA